jgi:hypothetical protein
LSISQIDGRAPLVISPIVFSLFIAIILIPIFLTIVDNIRTKKQKKPLASTIVYDNQLLSIKGVAQRQPWKDRGGMPTEYIGEEYLGDASEPSFGRFLFCNKISLTIKNEGILPIDTDVCKEPLAINLDVRGKLENIKVLDAKRINPRLDLSTRDGLVIIDNIHLEPSESLQIVFLGYFKVDLEELY